MENEYTSNQTTFEAENSKHPVFCVTPLSKYLAMVLFVTLPFVGGYFGYTFAPEKVVEIEKIVIKKPAPAVKEYPFTEPTDRGVLVTFSATTSAEIEPTEESYKIKSVHLSPTGNFVYFEQGRPDDPHGGRFMIVYDVWGDSYHPVEFVNDEAEYEQVDFSHSLYDLRYMYGSGAFRGWDEGDHLYYQIESEWNSSVDNVGRILYYRSTTSTTPWILAPKE